MIKVGDQAPTFSVPNQDGKNVTLSDYAGQYVLIWWYPKADTPGWTTEGNGFRDRIQEFVNKNAVVLGCSMDGPGDNKAFKEKFNFPYDLLSDMGKTMSTAYGAAKMDSARPNRVSVLIAPDGKVAAVYPKVTPADHPNEVLTTLDNLSP